MNERLQRILPYLPAAAVGLLTVALAWNVLHLGATVWSTHSVARHVKKLESLSTSDAEKKNPDSKDLDSKDSESKNPEAKAGPDPGSKSGPNSGSDSGDPGKRSRSRRGSRSGKGPSGRGDQTDLGPYAEILKKGLFAKMQEQPMPVCTGILDDAAIINNNLVKVGQQAGEWKLVEILQGKIVLEKEGKKQEILLFPGLPEKGGREGPPDGGRRGRAPRGGSGSFRMGPPPEQGGPGPAPSTGPDGLTSPSSGQSAPPGPSPGSDGGEGRGRMGISREQFQNMSPEEREKFREEMKQRRSKGE